MRNITPTVIKLSATLKEGQRCSPKPKSKKSTTFP